MNTKQRFSNGRKFAAISGLLLPISLLLPAAPALAQLPPGLPVPPENFATTHFFGSPATVNIQHFALGGAGVADNRSGWHSNPAGMVALRRPEVLLFGSSAGFDALPTFRTNFLGYAHPFGDNVLKISAVTVRANGQATSGPVPIGFKAKEDDLAIEFARRVTPRLSLGIGTAHLRTESAYSIAGVGEVTTLKSRPSSLGGRLGAIYEVNSRFSLGATFDFYRERVQREVPVLATPAEAFGFRTMAFRVGVALRPDSQTRLLADYENVNLAGNGTKRSQHSVLVGAERKFGPLSLRVGSYDGKLTGGLGFERGRLRLDYGFSGRYAKNLPGQGARAAHAFQVRGEF